MKAVLNASFILSVVFDEVNSKSSREQFEKIVDADLFTPSHFNQEISQAIYLGIEQKKLSQLEANLFLEYLSVLEIKSAPAPSFLRLKDFCIKEKISSYDASYLLLAKDIEAILLTTDKQMTAVAKRLQVQTSF